MKDTSQTLRDFLLIYMYSKHIQKPSVTNHNLSIAHRDLVSTMEILLTIFHHNRMASCLDECDMPAPSILYVPVVGDMHSPQGIKKH